MFHTCDDCEHKCYRFGVREGRMKSKSPRETIRAYCQHCTGGSLQEVKMCTADGKNSKFHACPFHPYRMGKRPSVRILRQFCLDCMGLNKNLVRDCTSYNCLVYPFRFGKNPNRSGIGASRERMNEISRKKATVSR
jgi:hypothetical protein